MDVVASPKIRLSLSLLSAATLLFEINLTRLYSVAQFYHFAFMIVSLALLGFGASGTFLALFPTFGGGDLSRRVAQLSLAAGTFILAGFILTNELPFDSYTITWDSRQVWILALHYLVQAAPFFCSGLVVSMLLQAAPRLAGTTYAANLAGSAAGCGLALFAPALFGGEGVVVLSSALACLAALVTGLQDGGEPNRRASGRLAGAAGLLLLCLLDLGLRLDDQRGLKLLELKLSPYKGLSYALQAPGSQVVYRRWNASARVDVVRSASIHSLPGLSFRYQQPLPAMDGLLVDGDDLSAVLLPGADPQFSAYLPTAAAFLLRPGAQTLALEPRGGLDVFIALAMGASQVTAVEVNPLIVAAAGEVYADSRVQVEIETGRSYLHRSFGQFDVILLCLNSGYHPVGVGAYSLAEDYRYTQEAFQDALARLSPEGVLSITRWLQDPPSEELRAFGLAISALEAAGLEPSARLFAFRGYNTATVLVKKAPFSQQELATLRKFATDRAFDLVYAPDLDTSELNRYNVLSEPIYEQAFARLLAAQPRSAFYRAYPYDVSPPSDEHPFFGHYFKWTQARQLLALLGRTWQPFGGAGYFLILALLLLSLAAAAALIVLPLSVRRAGVGEHASRKTSLLGPLLYFGMIGLAYLLVEIPLMQRFILYLGNPAYALTVVLFALLLFSALGSRMSARARLRPALLALVGLLATIPYLLPGFFAATLGLSLTLRLALSVVLLAPLGCLMGIPFPGGLRHLEPGTPVAWVWAVNGAASVVASVLAALLALSLGFSWVFWIGALCYLGAYAALPTQR